MRAQQLLEKISRQGIQSSSMDEMAALALAYWHRGFVPDMGSLSQLSASERAIVGYLTEFFSCFDCITDQQICALVEASRQIQRDLGAVKMTQNVDDIAAEWGLDENINQFLAAILPIQRRHFVPPPEEEVTETR